VTGLNHRLASPQRQPQPSSSPSDNLNKTRKPLTPQQPYIRQRKLAAAGGSPQRQRQPNGSLNPAAAGDGLSKKTQPHPSSLNPSSRPQPQQGDALTSDWRGLNPSQQPSDSIDPSCSVSPSSNPSLSVWWKGE
jgi:hypothetical protein